MLKLHAGRAEWMDKGHKKCLILWLRIQDWANYILNFVRLFYIRHLFRRYLLIICEQYIVALSSLCHNISLYPVFVGKG